MSHHSIRNLRACSNHRGHAPGVFICKYFLRLLLGGRACFKSVYVFIECFRKTTNWKKITTPSVGEFLLLTKTNYEVAADLGGTIANMCWSNVVIDNGAGTNCIARYATPQGDENFIRLDPNLTVRGASGNSLGIVGKLSLAICFGSTITVVEFPTFRFNRTVPETQGVCTCQQQLSTGQYWFDVCDRITFLILLLLHVVVSDTAL